MPFSEGFAQIPGDKIGELGYIDKTGNMVIQSNWDNAGDFHNGLAEVMGTNFKIGFIDKEGSLVIPYMWESGFNYRKEFCIVEDSDGIWCRIDRTGKKVCRTTK